MLYTRPEDRWTQRSEIRPRITSSGTSILTTSERGVFFALWENIKHHDFHFKATGKPTSGVSLEVRLDPECEGTHLISNAARRDGCEWLVPKKGTEWQTLLCSKSNLLVTTLSITSSGSSPPHATISSASRPTSVRSAICCLSRSPVESDRMSYFLTNRAVNVPLPAPGFPNMSMRSVLPDSGSRSSWALRYVLRKNGSALRATADWVMLRRWICAKLLNLAMDRATLTDCMGMGELDEDAVRPKVVPPEVDKLEHFCDFWGSLHP